jgi:hypothetical protein
MSTTRKSKLFAENPQRYLGLLWTLTMVINNFYPLNCCEKKDVRLLLSCFQFAQEKDLKEQEILKLDFLNKTRIRHHIVEVYQTMRSRLAASITKHVLSAPIPSCSFQVDLWKSMLSGEKYIGSSLMQPYFILHAALLLSLMSIQVASLILYTPIILTTQEFA